MSSSRLDAQTGFYTKPSYQVLFLTHRTLSSRTRAIKCIGS
jgi:hypothetical protein